ncbi:MAG TPA: hypothetical protein PLE74_12595 [Candidatus Cloacimonadota bacterium]|nr:hypothetical protein [Candidatus Cloacimonadota bacterium]
MKAVSENPHGDPISRTNFILIMVISYLLYFGILYGLFSYMDNHWHSWITIICRISVAILTLYVVWNRWLRVPALIGFIGAIITYWKAFGVFFRI